MMCVWMLLQALRVQAYKQLTGIHRACRPNKRCHPYKDPFRNKGKELSPIQKQVAVFPERCGEGAVEESGFLQVFRSPLLPSTVPQHAH